jgi:hypothetical protein
VSKKSIEEALAALEALREARTSIETLAQLRKALKHRNNYVASKAAALVAEFAAHALASDLIDAFDHFMQNPVKLDPQCWAKAAIAKALMDVAHPTRAGVGRKGRQGRRVARHLRPGSGELPARPTHDRKASRRPLG